MEKSTFRRSEYLSVKEFAEQLGYFTPYVNKMIREGKIEAVKRGRMFFISPKEVDRFVGLPDPKVVEELI